MAYDDYANSNSSGREIALYEFRWGTVFWRYTSADVVQTFDGNDFLPVSIRDEGMTQGGSSENDFTVTAQSDLPLVDLFGDAPPTRPVWLKVRRKSADDPDEEAPVYWVGRVANITRQENAAEANIRGISLGKLLKSGGLRLTWGKNCPHCIYDSACRVNPEDHKYTLTVAEVEGPLLTFEEDTVPAEGTFAGGYVEWDRSGEGTTELRGIENTISSTQVKVLGRLPGLLVGDSIDVYPGCDQTVSTCDEGFSNLDNNGGFFFMPEKSPFDGSQVFD